MPDHAFKHLDPGVVSDWKTSGNHDQIAELVTNSGSSLKEVLYEMCWVVVLGKVPVPSIVEVVQKIGSLDSVLCDLCWYIGIEVNHFESEEEKLLSKQWKNLCELVKQLAQAKVVPSPMLFERLELDLLEGAGLGDGKIMQKRLVRANTNNLYRQKKYNLLREESEGYTKLITELGIATSENTSTIVRNIQSLVGYFHLDPNRVFDLILDAYESDPLNSSFEALFSLFRPSNLAQILGFKFQMYQRPEIDEPTPRSLYRIAAILIIKGKLNADELLVHAGPDVDTVVLQREQYIDDLKVEASAIGRVSLTAAKQTAKEQQEQQRAKLEKRAAKLAEREKHSEANQKFGLVAGLIELGAWKRAKSLIDMFTKQGMEAMASHPAVLGAVDGLVSSLIEDMYGKVSPRTLQLVGQQQDKKSKKLETGNNGTDAAVKGKLPQDALVHPPSDYKGLLSEVGPLLVYLGHHMNTALMFKVCRLFKDLLENHNEICARNPDRQSDQTKARTMMLRVIGFALLPSLSMQPHSNPGLVCELWSVLSHLPFKIRYDLYERWRSSLYETVPELQLMKAQSSYDARQVLKRVAKEKDVMRIAGRRFAKVSHSNPLIAFTALLNNIQAYDNLIPVVVDSIKYLTPLGFDCLSYLLIVFLSKNDSKLKQDGTSHSQWLNAVCKFAGFFYAKYPTVELGGMWQYLIGQLKKNQPLDLLVLEEIVAKMSGFEVVEDFSDTSLMAMGGGSTLRSVARAALGASTASRAKQIIRLKESLETEKVTLPMLIMIAQQRESIVFASQLSKHLKMVGHLYDKSTSVLIQFSEFLSTQMAGDQFTEMLPTFSDMCNTYFVEPVVAFHLARPAIHMAQQKLYDAEEAFAALENVKTKKGNKAGKEQAAAALESARANRWVLGSDVVLEEVRTICPETVWESMSPTMYTTFWSLSLYDIFTPRRQYDDEIARTTARHDSLKRGEDPSLSSRKRTLEMQRCVQTVEKLRKELSAQISNHARVAEKLESMKGEWFPETLNRKTAVREFLQACVLPRALFSAEDALFCAKFVLLLHSISTPGFSTVNFFDKLVRNVMSCIFCVTEREAGNLAIYLRESLALLVKWRNDKKVYVKECESRPGFTSSFVDMSKKISYANFLVVYDRWHDRIGRHLLNALKSSKYMDIRQGLIVCSKIIDVYPGTMRIATFLKNRAENLAKNDERQDIRTLAKRYEALLRKQIKSGKLRDDRPASKTNKAANDKATSGAKANGTKTTASGGTTAKAASATAAGGQNKPKKQTPAPAKSPASSKKPDGSAKKAGNDTPSGKKSPATGKGNNNTSKTEGTKTSKSQKGSTPGSQDEDDDGEVKETPKNGDRKTGKNGPGVASGRDRERGGGKDKDKDGRGGYDRDYKPNRDSDRRKDGKDSRLSRDDNKHRRDEHRDRRGDDRDRRDGRGRSVDRRREDRDRKKGRTDSGKDAQGDKSSNRSRGRSRERAGSKKDGQPTKRRREESVSSGHQQPAAKKRSTGSDNKGDDKRARHRDEDRKKAARSARFQRK